MPHLGPRPPRIDSQSRIAPPGSASATVTRKKRKPAAKAASASTPTLPRKLTKNASRTAKPFSVNGHEQDEEEQRPHHVVDARAEVDPDCAARAQIARIRTAWIAVVKTKTLSSSRACPR